MELEVRYKKFKKGGGGWGGQDGEEKIRSHKEAVVEKKVEEFTQHFDVSF